MIYKSIIKIASILLIIVLNWIGLSAVIETFALYSDAEASNNNFYQAGTLDFSLQGGNWQPEEKAVNLLPGESVTTTISVINDGSFDFVYNASTTIDQESNLDFCNALNLKVADNSTTLYEGSLASLNFSPPILISNSQDDLLFTLTLSSSYIPPEDGANCIFKFIFRGWQNGLSFGQGFFDEEELENEVQIGGSTTSGYSPIADSYVNEDKKNNNYGNTAELQIRSQSNKNKRTFIRFDFNFPSGTTILSSALKLYMKSAPSVSRNYEVWRVLDNWNERDPNGINWNNQPPVATSLTATTFSGTIKNVWLSFDVTSDVQSFVSGTPNYGWMLKDSSENSSTTKFHSRESTKIELRPILEIQFLAPEVTTDHLVINEVYYHVGTGKGKDVDNEWVEIYNPTDSEVDISGWKICDANACDTIPASTSIPAKGFAIITNKASTWDKWPGIPPDAIKIVLNSAIGNGLANSGDSVILKNASNEVIDAMSYGSDTSQLNPPVSLSGKGKSLARIIKGYDTNSATDWIINATPNPGKNPSENGVETLIFGTFGVAVAGENPIFEDDFSSEEEVFEEAVVGEENFVDESGGEIFEEEIKTISEEGKKENDLNNEETIIDNSFKEEEPVIEFNNYSQEQSIENEIFETKESESNNEEIENSGEAENIIEDLVN